MTNVVDVGSVSYDDVARFCEIHNATIVATISFGRTPPANMKRMIFDFFFFVVSLVRRSISNGEESFRCSILILFLFGFELDVVPVSIPSITEVSNGLVSSDFEWILHVQSGERSSMLHLHWMYI